VKQISVYTSIFSIDKPFDGLKDFDESFLEEADFFCFTNLDIKSDKWKIINVPLKQGENPRLVARQYKILPHLTLEDYKYHFWLDGSIELLESPKKIVDKYLKDHVITALLHPDRSCIYKEGDACIGWRLDDPYKINKQMQFMKHEGYPENNGLCETGVIIRENTKEIKDFNKYWWSMVSTYSLRDQLSFNYCLWKHNIKHNLFEGLTNVQLTSPSESVQTKLFKLHNHGK